MNVDDITRVHPSFQDFDGAVASSSDEDKINKLEEELKNLKIPLKSKEDEVTQAKLGKDGSRILANKCFDDSSCFNCESAAHFSRECKLAAFIRYVLLFIEFITFTNDILTPILEIRMKPGPQFMKKSPSTSTYLRFRGAPLEILCRFSRTKFVFLWTVKGFNLPSHSITSTMVAGTAAALSIIARIAKILHTQRYTILQN